MRSYAIGIDIGRTYLRTALVGPGGEVMATAKERTCLTSGPQGVAQQATRAFEGLAATHDIHAAGIGIAGQCDTVRGLVSHGPNLFWPDVPFRDLMSDLLGIPVTLRNDVVMATVGEWRHGAGAGYENMVALFAGSGIGGGAIVNGTLLEGASGQGGHLGHVSVQMDGPWCGCGRQGCVEAYASGLGLASRAGEHPLLPASSLSRSANIDGVAVATAVEEGDALAIQLRDDAASALASAIGSVINCLEPQVVVLGGAVMEGLPGLYRMCSAGALKNCLPSHRDVAITRSSLGEMAGAIGAASLALDPL